MAPQPANRTVHTRNAFTLVEMLVVIVIICILAALLMPVLSGAYRTAMKSADAALIHQIAMGCEAYNQVFHEYPQSAWHPAPAAATVPDFVWPPPDCRSAPIAANRLRLDGSAKIFAYLSGFNALGCWDPANPLDPNLDPTTWVAPCGDLTFRGIIVDTNAADNGGVGTEDKVYGPYYNPDEKGQTMTTIRWSSGRWAQERVFASRFARRTPSTPPPGGVPETGAPILYYRAAPSPRDADTDGVISTWDIYNYQDNFAITDAVQAENSANFTPYDTSAGKRTHPLYAPSNGKLPNGSNYDGNGDGQQDFGISRPATSASAGAPDAPYNANSFILISPGPDGEYFTEDDITNFRQ